ncbi:hypothetical protein BV22DRAFT_1035246 [Leucogyrophana mollusca]|uniref:Uncharacterized protein n=1 Tax=Leucogyrophana mollusca TaxID=85980 RepID=A0ACB8BGG0_9AGAM|nr:hypothetical protein BV22DRAFT_1035246 [Leucogyrophana mollusca]
MSELTATWDVSWAVRVVNYHCVASLCFMVWDILVTLDVEVQHVWPKPRQALFKWLYLLIRYGALVLQIFHQFAVPFITEGRATASLCKAWFMYAVITAQAMTSAVELILMTRVYALYNKSRRIALLLFALAMCEIMTLAINSVHTIPNLQASNVEICILAKPPPEIVYYSLTVLLTQSTLLVLTILKHVFVRRMGLGRTPIVSQLTRDGTVVYGIMFVLLLMTAVFCKSDQQITIVMFFWSMSVSSTCGCRLIINMQRLSKYEDARSDTAAQFTSDIELDAYIHSAQETIEFSDCASVTLACEATAPC